MFFGLVSVAAVAPKFRHHKDRQISFPARRSDVQVFKSQGVGSHGGARHRQARSRAPQYFAMAESNISKNMRLKSSNNR